MPIYRVLWMLLLLSLGVVSCRGTLEVVERPIEYDIDRRALSLAYLEQRYGLLKSEPSIRPEMIVVHWTGIPSLEGSFAAFDPPRLGSTRPDIQEAGALNVSAHYLIDRNGVIYRLLPDTLMARHVIGLNHCSIGIENVGGTSETSLTRQQLRANARLIRHLIRQYPVNYVIGHHEYTLFEGHPLWLEKDSAYRTVKYDPGESFIRALRRKIHFTNPAF